MDSVALVLQIERLEQGIDELEDEDSPHAAKRLLAMRETLESARQQLAQMKGQRADGIANKLSESLNLGASYFLETPHDPRASAFCSRSLEYGRVDSSVFERLLKLVASYQDVRQLEVLLRNERRWRRETVRGTIEELRSVPHESPAELHEPLERLSERWTTGRRSHAQREQETERRLLEAICAR